MPNIDTMMSKKKIFVYLNGGLGNQLFQFSKARHFGGNSREVVIIENAGGPRQNSSGDLELSYAIGSENFRITSILRSERLFSRICNLLLRIGIEVENSRMGLIFLDLISMLAKVPLSMMLGTNVQVIVCRGHGTYQAKKRHNRGNLLLIGYFQSRTHTEASRGFILESLEMKHGSKSKAVRLHNNIEDKLPLGIHVRRGDYTSESKIGCLNDHYYLNAYRRAIKDFPYKEVWLFTEEASEIVDLKVQLNDLPIRVFTRHDYDTPNTLLIMSSCKGMIMSNSTYSWWAVFISNSLVDKRIYCPTPWFRELRESKKLFSEREIRIESLWLN